MNDIDQVRDLLLGMLEGAFTSPSADVSATQQMGVSMSNAVKKDGVVIIQNQNVEIYHKIVPTIVQAVRICDKIVAKAYEAADHDVVDALPEQTAPIQIEHDPFEACCRHLYQEQATWDEMQDLMKAKYMDYVLNQCPTKVAAAKFLGVGPTYLSKLSKRTSAGPD